MTSKKDFVLAIIDLYRESPCLWKVSDDNYHDKIKRNAALDSILEVFKTQDSRATRETVKAKLNSMRGSFRKELNKVRASEKSGTSSEDVHVPKLWYFQNLLFLEDSETPRSSQTVQSILDDFPFENDEDETEEEQIFSVPVPESSVPSPRAQPSFKRPRSKADMVLDKIAKKIDSSEKPIMYSAFGSHVAERLRGMPREMATICQKVISDAIFHAELNRLNLDSHIVSNTTEIVYMNAE